MLVGTQPTGQPCLVIQEVLIGSGNKTFFAGCIFSTYQYTRSSEQLVNNILPDELLHYIYLTNGQFYLISSNTHMFPALTPRAGINLSQIQESHKISIKPLYQQELLTYLIIKRVHLDSNKCILFGICIFVHLKMSLTDVGPCPGVIWVSLDCCYEDTTSTMTL